MTRTSFRSQIRILKQCGLLFLRGEGVVVVVVVVCVCLCVCVFFFFFFFFKMSNFSKMSNLFIFLIYSFYGQIMNHELIKHIVGRFYWHLPISVCHLESHESASGMVSWFYLYIFGFGNFNLNEQTFWTRFRYRSNYTGPCTNKNDHTLNRTKGTLCMMFFYRVSISVPLNVNEPHGNEMLHVHWSNCRCVYWPLISTCRVIQIQIQICLFNNTIVRYTSLPYCIVMFTDVTFSSQFNSG